MPSASVQLPAARFSVTGTTERLRSLSLRPTSLARRDILLEAGSVPSLTPAAILAIHTAGAIELDYSSSLSNNSLRVVTRTYTPSLPNPTVGAVLFGLVPNATTGILTLVGLGNNGGNHLAGFRSNAGVYNPYPFSTSVTFQLMMQDGTTPLGQAVTQSWGAFEARQINDIFGTAGAGSVVTTNALLKVTSALPLFPYVTVIDNRTGDSILEWEFGN